MKKLLVLAGLACGVIAFGAQAADVAKPVKAEVKVAKAAKEPVKAVAKKEASAVAASPAVAKPAKKAK